MFHADETEADEFIQQYRMVLRRLARLLDKRAETARHVFRLSQIARRPGPSPSGEVPGLTS